MRRRATQAALEVVGPEAHRLKYHEIFNLLEKHGQLQRLFAAYDITAIDAEPAP